jgi:hypothetical protein
MIEELSHQQIEEILKSTTGRDPIPRYSDEGRWREIMGNPMLSLSFEEYKKRLDKDLEEPITFVPASLYLNYRRTGSRSPHDGIIGSRRSRLMAFVIGECMERKGRFMDAIMDHAWAICEESSWVIPAHSRTSLPEYTDISWIDLFSAETGRVLAETVYMIGDRMDEHDPMIRQRILHEIERRCWQPYMERNDFWWLFATNRAHVNNWTAVCNCGVVGAAILAMEDNPLPPFGKGDTTTLAKMIEKCLRSMNDFLRCFDPDGGCDEGPGYWGYGVSNYVWLSYLMEMRTEGKLSLLNAPEMRDIAMFPQRATLSGQNVANFSDCSPRVGFPPSLMFYLGERLSVPQISAFAQYQYDLSSRGFGRYGVRDLAWMPKEPYPEKWEREAHVYFSGQQWMISRADADDENSLILAAKGGNNGENHNQNDVGNFIVHCGGESLIVDLGSGTYTKDYFSGGRYEILVNSSWGHNVPLINGCQQPAGAQYAAQVVEHSSSEAEDALELELKGAYPKEAKLESLRRRMSLHRSPDRIDIDDQIHLDEKMGVYRCPLYTFGEVTQENEGELRIGFDTASPTQPKVGEKAEIMVQYQPRGMAPAIEQVDLKDRKFTKPVSRIVFDVPIQNGSGSLHLRISPSAVISNG